MLRWRDDGTSCSQRKIILKNHLSLWILWQVFFNLSDEDVRLRHRQVHGFLVWEGEDDLQAAVLIISLSVCLIVQKVIMTCWLNSQTHSAYMLFYKRVELEEENGKDFSFDVSPDLLEVPSLCSIHLKSHKYFSLNIWNSHLNLCVSFSGSGTTTCSFSRTKTYLNTLTLGWYQNLWRSDSDGLNQWIYHFYSPFVSCGCVFPALCGSSAAASPAHYQTLKPSPSWPLRWEITAFKHWHQRLLFEIQRLNCIVGTCL